jgi:hypothetical protein
LDGIIKTETSDIEIFSAAVASLKIDSQNVGDADAANPRI